MDEDHPIVLVLRAGGSDPVLVRLEIDDESLVRLQVGAGNGGVKEYGCLPYLPVQVFVVVPIRFRCVS
ncbi:hypothetical protein GCM10022419_080900 [Nonomuraea rosea]|uniref:Uncharacterized protein n=1 Tax=Nonomuraea rosea TaxID=638574 RepID=A0ABP6YMA7_9ACTN